MAKTLQGKEISNRNIEIIKDKIELLKQEHKTLPKLGVIYLGDEAGSISYLKGIKKRCEEVELELVEIKVDTKDTTKDILNKLDGLNKDELIKGILVIRPFGKEVDEDLILKSIDPLKDIEGVTDYNQLLLYQGKKDKAPCTARAVIEILDYYGIEIKGKKVVVVGRSLTVGRPSAALFLNRNATVTIAHSKSDNLKDICRSADICVFAIGKAKSFDYTWVKDDGVVIDVGVNYDQDGKLCGDFDPKGVDNSHISYTPVPNGVGSVTTSILLKGVIENE